MRFWYSISCRSCGDLHILPNLPSFFYLLLYQLISIFYIYMQHFLFWGCVAGSVGFSIEKRTTSRAKVFIPWLQSICMLDFRIHWFAYLLRVALRVSLERQRSGKGLKVKDLIIELSKRFCCNQFTWSTSTKPWAWGERDARYLATATPTNTAAINATPANAIVK